MIIRPQDKNNILISGFFILLSLFVVGISVFLLSSENNLFSRKIDLYIDVKNAQNLKTGAEVQLRGIKIGSVSEIKVTSLEYLRITLSVTHRHREWIRSDSYVAFKTQGVLGDRFLEILGGNEGSPIVNDQEILKVQESNQLDNFINKGEDILVVAGRVLQKVDLILGDVETTSIPQILANLEQTTSSTQKLFATLNSADLKGLIKNLNDSSTQLKNTMGSVSKITKHIEEGPGTMNSLIYDRSVHDDLKTILGGTKRNRVLQYFIRESIKKGD